MSVIILNADAQTASIYGGSYFMRTILNGGTATLKVSIRGGDTSFSDFDNNSLSDGMKVISLPSGRVELTKTGAAVVELLRVDC